MMQFTVLGIFLICATCILALKQLCPNNPEAIYIEEVAERIIEKETGISMDSVLKKE